MIAFADILTAPDYRAVMRVELLRASHRFAVSVGEDARASRLADHILDQLKPRKANS